jgi:hypothetical protein
MALHAAEAAAEDVVVFVVALVIAGLRLATGAVATP